MRKLVILIGAIMALITACDRESRQMDKAASPAQVQQATVVRAVDGDTIVVKINGAEKTVRLIGIDTPETHKPGVKVECGGERASRNMHRLAPAGAKAVLRNDPTQDKIDRYGRLLAYVSVKGRLLQLEQVYDGNAKVYVYGGHPFEKADDFRRAEGVARRAHRGVWSKCHGDFHSEQ